MNKFVAILIVSAFVLVSTEELKQQSEVVVPASILNLNKEVISHVDDYTWHPLCSTCKKVFDYIKFEFKDGLGLTRDNWHKKVTVRKHKATTRLFFKD